MSFKPGAANSGKGQMKLSNHNVNFKSHINPRMTFFEQSPRGFSQETLEESMKDASMVSNFLKPAVNIHRYKAFPEWTETLNR